ncbi:MAG: hypothetical protein ACRCZI_07470 [Cetobacterium sp.]
MLNKVVTVFNYLFNNRATFYNISKGICFNYYDLNTAIFNKNFEFIKRITEFRNNMPDDIKHIINYDVNERSLTYVFINDNIEIFQYLFANYNITITKECLSTFNVKTSRIWKFMQYFISSNGNISGSITSTYEDNPFVRGNYKRRFNNVTTTNIDKRSNNVEEIKYRDCIYNLTEDEACFNLRTDSNIKILTGLDNIYCANVKHDLFQYAILNDYKKLIIILIKEQYPLSLRTMEICIDRKYDWGFENLVFDKIINLDKNDFTNIVEKISTNGSILMLKKLFDDKILRERYISIIDKTLYINVLKTADFDKIKFFYYNVDIEVLYKTQNLVESDILINSL